MIFFKTKIFILGLLKEHPELEGKITSTVYRKGIKCPKCGESGNNGTEAILYKVIGNDEWHQYRETQSCSNCRNFDVINIDMKNDLEAQKKEIGNRLMNEYTFIPESLKNAGFKDYDDNDDVAAKAKKTFISFVKDIRDGNYYNLLAVGSTGTGKTHLSVATIRTLKEYGNIVGLITPSILLSLIKETYQTGAIKTEAQVFRDLEKFEVLVVDDLGAEAIGGNDWIISMLFRLVESRAGKPTIYTTNLIDEQLENAIGSRVYSRLKVKTKTLDMFTYDYRDRLQIKL